MSDDALTFDAVVAKVQTLVDNGIRVTLDLLDHGFVEQQRGNQKPGYDEKYVDADKPPGKTGKARVIRNHGNYRNGAQAIDVRTVFAFGGLKVRGHPMVLLVGELSLFQLSK